MGYVIKFPVPPSYLNWTSEDMAAYFESVAPGRITIKQINRYGDQAEVEFDDAWVPSARQKTNIINLARALRDPVGETR